MWVSWKAPTHIHILQYIHIIHIYITTQLHTHLFAYIFVRENQGDS